MLTVNPSKNHNDAKIKIEGVKSSHISNLYYPIENSTYDAEEYKLQDRISIVGDTDKIHQSRRQKLNT